MKLKIKLLLGLSVVFVAILAFGSLSVYYISRLSTDSKLVLQNNHESLVYCNNMFIALEDIPQRQASIKLFDDNLQKQEANITEAGERQETEALRRNFNELITDPKDSSNYKEIRKSLEVINDLNQDAILRKNATAKKTADDARVLLTIIFSLLAILTLTFVINFPSVISNPVKALNEGIREIANKNYRKRIHIDSGDEFGELANAFNTMAEKLDEYESSNLAQLRFEKSRIETIINQMKDGIIGLDKNKNVIFLNAVAEKLSGLKEAEIVGRYSADIAVKNDLIRSLLQNETNKELKIYADNKESFFHKDILDVVNNGEVIGQVIVLRNITSFHELNEAKTNFIATISHELKTPISSIKMSATLLNDERIGGLNKEQVELIKSITDDSERLLKITGELLNMSQVETGNIQLKLKSTNPAVIIQQAIEAVTAKAQQKNISVKINIEANIPMVQADVEKTSWVLINFLTNAIKYSSNDTIIDVNAIRKGKMVEFAVKDYGRGIEEKYISRLFDRYYKVPGNYETDGTGLGLAISKEFIEAQGGNIKAESDFGAGSRFSFTMNII